MVLLDVNSSFLLLQNVDFLMVIIFVLMVMTGSFSIGSYRIEWPSYWSTSTLLSTPTGKTSLRAHFGVSVLAEFQFLKL